MSAGDSLNPKQFHPNVLPYRDGGLGGVGADHSVVGMVPTSSLIPLRHYDRTQPGEANYDSRQVIDGIRADLRSGKGLENPLMVDYDHKAGWAVLGEGNHRLQAAIEEGHTHLPVRVARSQSAAVGREQGIGAPMSHTPIPGVTEPSYVPTDMHPRYLFGEHNERVPVKGRSSVAEIQDLLK